MNFDAITIISKCTYTIERLQVYSSFQLNTIPFTHLRDKESMLQYKFHYTYASALNAHTGIPKARDRYKYPKQRFLRNKKLKFKKS